jgi:hypothetical protein
MATTTRNRAGRGLVVTLSAFQLAQDPVQLGQPNFQLDLGNIFAAAVHL